MFISQKNKHTSIRYDPIRIWLKYFKTEGKYVLLRILSRESRGEAIRGLQRKKK